jgi:hypothetical protein
VRAAIFGWGVLGAAAVLASPAARTTARGLDAWATASGPARVGALVWIGWMLLSAGWIGFHRAFAPRAALRALRLADEPVSGWALVAPLVAVGLFRATPRRRAVTLGIAAGVGAASLGARALGEPARGLLDLGVGIALWVGAGSVGWHAARAWVGRAPAIDAGWR